jgi:hypothetical protein
MRLVVALLVLSACVFEPQIRGSHVLTGIPGRPHPGAKIVMVGGATPEQAEEVAILQIRGTHGAALPEVIAGLQAEAQDLGCDAVVQVQVDQGATMVSATGVCVRTSTPPLVAGPWGKCVASALPEWKTASADERKELVERCR